MELWVRSQDKMNLVKVRQASVNYQNNKQIIANYTPELYENSGEYYELLGTYKTKERSLEVLDEIDEFIDLFQREGIGNVLSDNGVHPKHTIYEMPKE